MASGKVLEQLVVMLKYAVLWIRDLPKLVKGTLEIVVDFVKELGRFAGQMQELARHGAMLVKGVVEGDTIPTYYLMFRNAILESGSLEEMGVALKRIVEQGKADLAQFLERMFWMKTGTGGGYKFLTEYASWSIVAQEEPMSCAAACVRQYLEDVEVSIEESVLRGLLDTTEDGTPFINIRHYLQAKFPDKVFRGGLMDLRKQEEAIEFINRVDEISERPWFVQIRKEPLGNSHTVIVDAIADGIVYIRDPWNLKTGWGIQLKGTAGTMRFDDFIMHWQYGSTGIIYVKR